MPKMSDTMTEGVLAKWHKKVGDKIKSGDVLAEIETDKATMDFESYQDGTLLYIGVEEGKAVPVDAIIAVLGKDGEDYKAALTAGATAAPAAEAAPAEAAPKPVEDKKPAPATEAKPKVDLSSIPATAAPVNGIIAIVGKEGTDITPLLQDDAAPAASKEAAPASESPVAEEALSDSPTESTPEDDSRVKASPLARKIAKEKGINLNEVKGSAEGGRIVKKDVEDYVPAAKAPAVAASAAPAPVAAPASAPAAPAPAAKPITLPTVVGEERFTEKPVSQMRKAISRRLSESLFTAPHFYVTMSIDMDEAIKARTRINEVAPIRFNEHINIGVAVAVDEGLLVPVIKYADSKSFSHISVEVKEFAAKAKAKKLQPAEMEGSTFTISNLGMFGVDEFTAIINTPNACILAVSGIQQVPVVKNGAVVPGNVMKVTLSCDHRVVDGASGAAFLQTLKGLLEEPVRLLI
eukprot:gene9047-9127_t